MSVSSNLRLIVVFPVALILVGLSLGSLSMGNRAVAREQKAATTAIGKTLAVMDALPWDTMAITFILLAAFLIGADFWGPSQ